MVEFTAGTTERSGTESPVANVPYLDFPGDLIFQLAASYVPENNEGKLHYEITGGADAGLFTIVNDVLGEENWANLILHGENWSDGRVDYETNLAFGGGTYAVNVTVTSTLNGAQSTGTFSITVLDYSIVSWTTFFISGGGNPLAVTNVINDTIEEGAANGTELFDVEATDGSGSPVYSLSADSSNGAFQIDAVTGVVSVKDGSLINYENNGPYTITVKAAENANDFVTRDFTISVTDVAPSTPVDDDAADNEVAENTADVTVGVMAFATDVAGGDVRYSVADTRFVIDEVSGIVKVAPNGFPLGLDFEATPSIDLEVTASTVNGGLVSKQTFTIDVLDGNDAPVMFQQYLSPDENQTSAGMVVVTDEDNDTLTYELTGGGADASFFTIDQNTGELSFKSAPDFETRADADNDGTYLVEVKANDGKGGTVTEIVSVILSNQNEAPVFDKTAFKAAENFGGAADVFAADVDANDSIEYTITGGADFALFSIGKTNGFLDFVSPPDFETKTDNDNDGVYEVEVTATDEGGLTDVQFIKITVTDQNDAPQITSTAFNIAENKLVVGPLTVTDQDPGDTLFKNFFVTGGADGDLFTVDSQTGELSFLVAPDFENKQDADQDNVYEVQVSVSDNAGAQGKQVISVTVTDVAIEPGVTIVGTGGADKITPLVTVAGQKFSTTNDDNIDGKQGNDHIDGWLGPDKLNGGLGIDTVSYASSLAGVVVNLQQQGTSNATGVATADGTKQSGGDADGDLLWGFENILGSAKDDTLTGDQFANTIEGGNGDDRLDGSGGIDTLRGGEGNDSIYGGNGAGADLLDGGAGTNDTIDYSADDGAGITINLSTQATVSIAGVFSGGTAGVGGDAQGDKFANFENIIGSLGNDKLTGNDGVNTLAGGNGNDVIQGLGGADKLDGGDNTDTVSYALSNAGVSVDLNKQDGVAQQKGGHAEGDTLENFENVIGSGFNDLLTATAATQFVDGGTGDDVIVASNGEMLLGGTGTDTLSFAALVNGVNANLGNQGTVNTTRTGVSGAEIVDGYRVAEFENLIGTSEIDELTGNTGNNVIEGGAGGDKLDGGAHATGGDTLSYASSGSGVNVVLDLATFVGTGAGGDAAGDKNKNFENLIGGAFNDILEGNSLANNIKGGALNDLIRGHGGDDTLSGEGGDDEIFGGIGKDVMDGGTGFDILHYDDLLENITLTLGNNGAQTTIASNTPGAESNGDKIANFEQVVTGKGNDRITGSTGIDVIYAGEGNDLVVGGLGADELYGQDGIDTLSYVGSNSAVTVDLSGPAANGGHATGDSFSGFENVIGSAFDDTLTGDAAANTLDGGTGNDLIEGRFGGDKLVGGTNIATVGDTVSYASSASKVEINLTQQGTYNATTGLITGASSKAQTGGDADGDLLSGFENIIGSAGNDVLTGTTGNNIIEGGAGADILDGAGGTGDTLSYASSGTKVSVKLENVVAGISLVTIINTGGDADGDNAKNFENILGSIHHDVLTGNTLANILQGNDGDDTLAGGLGADKLIGGAGNDTVDYSSSNIAVTVNLKQQGTFVPATLAVTGAVGQTGGHAASDLLSGIENIIGSAFSDVFVGDGSANKFEGGGGNNTVSYTSSTVAVIASLLAPGTNTGDAAGDSYIDIANLTGSAKNDILTGDENANIIIGGDGNDLIAGGKSVDFLDGGAGTADIVSYADAVSGVVVNLALQSTATFTGGTNQGNAGIGFDKITGFEGAIGSGDIDTITGNTANNIIEGGDGADILDGAGGTGDILSYASSAFGVNITLNDGPNVLATASGGDATGDQAKNFEHITGSADTDNLIGNSLANILKGGGSGDFLSGLGGADVLFGGFGDDTLAGGAAADKLAGGDGVDTADYSTSLSNVGVTIKLATQGVFNETTNAITGASAQAGGDAAGDLLSSIENVIGSTKNDTITGDGNDNRIDGRSGNDVLDGGLGNDTFVYSGSFGLDTIKNFQGGAGAGDIIELSDAQFADFAAVQLSWADTIAGNVVITLDGSNTITIFGRTTAQLHQDDFVFMGM